MKRSRSTLLSAKLRTTMVRAMFVVFGVVVWASAGSIGLHAQSDASSGQSAKPTSDNPFPGDGAQTQGQQPATGQQSGAGQAGQGKPGDGSKAGTPPKKASDNPFPGEESDAPIIPSGPDSNAGRGAGQGSSPARNGNSNVPSQRDPDGDPVRSPDGPGHYSDSGSDSGGDDGFSSSLSGVNAAPAPDTAKAPVPVHVENVTEDVNVGQFYLQSKNWKAAQLRFAAAFAADKENPDAVWGLAEAERHLALFKEADEHYKLFLTYDPTGPHGKAARKALEEVEAELNSPNVHKNSHN